MKLFGTDGIRAPFGTYPLDPDTILHLGYRLGCLLHRGHDRPLVVMGGDTRASTEEICGWLATGLGAADVEPVFGGVLPTPAVASLVVERRASAGISVSASHNPYPDNGIKLFDAAGFKWSPDAEAELEAMLADAPPSLPQQYEPVETDPGLAVQYVSLLRSRLGAAQPFDGLKIVLDCANGAATAFAVTLFELLGADVVPIGNQPDGFNINQDCGSTAPQAMTQTVLETTSHLGVAFDGDADRALLADENGQVRDGDAMLYIWARHLLSLGALEPSSIVATSMSNLGLERALGRLGISVIRCDVGDRNVVATMVEHGVTLGGEQSGHLIHLQNATTGDGLSTALQMARIVHESGMSLSELLREFRRFPQVLKNIRVVAKPPLDSLPSVSRIVREVENRLGTDGRLVLRYSGTEPLARVMIEGPEQSEIDEMADLIVNAIHQEVGEPESPKGSSR